MMGFVFGVAVMAAAQGYALPSGLNWAVSGAEDMGGMIGVLIQSVAPLTTSDIKAACVCSGNEGASHALAISGLGTTGQIVALSKMDAFNGSFSASDPVAPYPYITVAVDAWGDASGISVSDADLWTEGNLSAAQAPLESENYQYYYMMVFRAADGLDHLNDAMAIDEYAVVEADPGKSGEYMSDYPAINAVFDGDGPDWRSFGHVPEPTTMALLAVGGLVFGLRRKNRK